MLYSLILTLMIGWLPLFAYAQPKPSDEHLIIAKISIKGLMRTKTEVVQQELLFKKGDIFQHQRYETSLQRLNNLQLFSHVNGHFTKQSNNQIHITITVEERWTIIPFFTVSSGGGTQFIQAGAYDKNFLGQNRLLGIQYENWNNAHSGSLWYTDPRLFHQRIKLNAWVGNTRRPKSLYQFSGQSIGNYVLYRNILMVFVEKELSNQLKTGMGFSFYQDQYLSSDVKSSFDQTIEQQLDSTHVTHTLLSQISFTYGRLNYEQHLIKGRIFKINFSYSTDQLVSKENFYRSILTTKWFIRPTNTSNFGIHMMMGSTNATTLPYQYRIGGLGSIRGYSAGQFTGKQFTQTNIEFRISSFRHPWIVLQHILFLDTIHIFTPSFDIEHQQTQTAMSIGTGLRLISPKIYGFNGRIDFAYTSNNTQSSFISFGTQQFF